MKSFQEDVPRARVNITLDAKSSHGAASRELPMRVLVLCNFLGDLDARALVDRPRLRVSRSNINHVMQMIRPQLSLEINDETLGLKFESLEDFKPKAIAEKLPKLCEMASKRECLKALKQAYKNDPRLRSLVREALEVK